MMISLRVHAYEASVPDQRAPRPRATVQQPRTDGEKLQNMIVGLAGLPVQVAGLTTSVTAKQTEC